MCVNFFSHKSTLCHLRWVPSALILFFMKTVTAEQVSDSKWVVSIDGERLRTTKTGMCRTFATEKQALAAGRKEAA